MNPKQKRKAELDAAQSIAQKAKDEGRAFTDAEREQLDTHMKAIDELDGQIKDAARTDRIMGLVTATTDGKESGVQAKTLGEHFVQHAGKRLSEIRGVNGASVSAPEYKVATDTQTIGAVFQNPVLTQFDRTVIPALRPRLVVADLLSQGTLSGNAISYFVEGALEGAFTAVAEGAAKPQLHFVDPTLVTDALKKLAGFIKFTDEMAEDLDFYVSEINNRLVYELAKFEEAQILNGAGTGSNLLGLLQRSGIQTETGATIADNADAVFRAMTKVSTGSGLDADGIVINPTDYQAFRLKKDSNAQYYGGGFFAGEYGTGTLTSQPPLWGLRTVVTPAITVGTVLVGAFQQAATLYRKGGIRVESTNSNASDFTSNLITTRAEERVALAVRRPAGLVKLTLGIT